MSAPAERDPLPGDEPALQWAGLFGRHDFQDLWTESVVGGEDLAAAAVLRADDIAPHFDPDIGPEIDPTVTLFNELSAAIKVNDQGVWIKEGKQGRTATKGKKGKPARGVEPWSPRMHTPEAGNWRDMPALPFPFTPGDLAAFMLDGPGRWLADAFGGLDRPAPDLSCLPVGRDMQAAAERTKRLLMLAWEAYHAALKEAGPRPVDPADAIPAHLLRQAEDGAGGVDQADGFAAGPAWSADAQQAWLGAMCRKLVDQPRATAIAAAATAAGDAAEPIATRRSRRLARLRELGADLQRADDATAGDGWQLTGERGALAQLAREERAAKRPQSDERDVKRDLVSAIRVDRGY